jgi:putative membrane protein
MRATIFSVFALCPIVAFASPLFAQSNPMTSPSASQTQPNQPGNPVPPTTSLQDSSGAPGDTAQQMKDKMFVRNAAQGGLAEVELGKLAAEKGSSEDVKAFGKRMVEDHTKLNQDIAQLADSIGARVPKKMDKDQQAEYDKLSSLSGEDFDKEYITFMVKDHHSDLREFRMEASSTSDPDLKTAVDNGARVIREHMIAADKMAHDRGIPMPGHHHRPSEASTGTTHPSQ